MAINKVAYGTTVLVDLTGTTATSDKILSGYGAYGKDGVWMDGTASAVSEAIADDITKLQSGGDWHNVYGVDLTLDTVTADKLLQGYTAHDSAGNAITGTYNGGGSLESVAKKQINFIDFDGSILYSYTSSEWSNITVLPDNPSHNGLVAQGWNWTKAQIDAQLASLPDGDVWIGQMYVTQSGDTEIDVSFPTIGRLSPTMAIAVNGTVSIDWGDNTNADTITDTSLTVIHQVAHTYENAGNYTIVVHVVSGTFQFHGENTYTLLHKNNVTILNENRVYGNAIQAIRLGSGITNISSYTFYYCYSLTSITIPNSVTSIDSYAFSFCESLISITIPSSVTSISDRIINSSSSLASVAIPSGITSIGTYAFASCDSLSSITIPNNVTSMGTYAVSSCYSLASVAIPSNLTSINTGLFSADYCLTSMTIPSSVTSISENAFNNCYGVGEYHFLPTTPPTLADSTTVFRNIVSDCKIYVPLDSLTAYKEAANWSTFASYMIGE